jgi:hypothetical protein
VPPGVSSALRDEGPGFDHRDSPQAKPESGAADRYSHRLHSKR